jgi:hypothetical protein
LSISAGEDCRSPLTTLLDAVQFLRGSQTQSSMHLPFINKFVLKNLKTIELIGVMMRIASFSLVSWLGPHSPFLLVWVVNTADAVALSWCAMLKRDAAYILLNVFWVIIGIVGICRAAGLLR